LSCEQNHLTYPSKIPPTDLVGFCRWFSSWWSLSRSVKPSRFRPVTNLRNRIGSKLRIRVNDKTSRRRWWRLQRKPPCKEWGLSNLCVSEKSSNEERDTIRNKKFWTIPKSFYTSDGDLKMTASSEWFSWIHIVPVPFAQGTNLHRKIHHWNMSWWKDVLRHRHLRDEFLVLSSAIANLGLL